MKTSIALLGASSVAVLASVWAWFSDVDRTTFEAAVSLALLGIMSLLGWIARPDVRALLVKLNIPVGELEDTDEVKKLKSVAAEQARQLKSIHDQQFADLVAQVEKVAARIEALDSRFDNHINDHANGSVSGLNR